MDSFPVGRDRGRGRFKDRGDYYDHGPARAQKQFCKIIEAAVPEFGPVEVDNPLQWEEFPWVTPVIGSGCVQLTDDSKTKLRELSELIRTQVGDIYVADLRDRSETYGTEKDAWCEEAEIARAFAASLVDDRVPEGPGRPGARPAIDHVEFEVSPLASRIVLLAALLTRFYFNAKAAANQPLGRPTTDFDDLDEAFLERGFRGSDADIARELSTQCAWHCQQCINELRLLPDETMPGTLRDALSNLLNNIMRSMTGRSPDDYRTEPVLKRMNLRMMTEISWYFVMNEIQDYPGWSEILFGIMLRGVEGSVGTTRPHFVLHRDRAALVTNLLLPASLKSWRTDRADEATDDFFAAAAQVLRAESEVIDSVAKRAADLSTYAEKDQVPPPAVAFVTSFDLELDMAMWRATPIGDSFFVVMPVHIFRNNQDRIAQPCWIRGEIKKEADQVEFDAFRTPKNWIPLTAKTNSTVLREGPHIVHLNGAPLLNFPKESEEFSEFRAVVCSVMSGNEAERYGDSSMIEPAVVTDEYLAVRLAEVDLSFQLYGEKDASNRSDRSLPRLLTSSTRTKTDSRSYNPRFWVIAGVALSDPAVRYRLVSQLGFGRMLGGRSAENTPTMGGDDVPAKDSSADMFGINKSSLSAVEDPDKKLLTVNDGEDAVPSEIGFTGIAINRRITVDEASLLYWMGFDVIRDWAASFARDLRHFADHLRAGGRKAWPPKDTTCTLPAGGGAR